MMIETLALDELKKKLTPFFAQDFHQFHPFHPVLIEFCEVLSEALFQIKPKKEYPDYIALAFWLRKSHLQQLQEDFKSKSSSDKLLVPRGLVFHIPPANIDVMLVYSWICSLIMGNGNIIRLPSTKTPRAGKLIDTIQKVLCEERFRSIRQMTCFLRYGHEEAYTAWISLHVNSRIIWGGDETIANIRKIPLQPYAKDLAFPDRFSFGVIQADAYLKASQEDKATLAINSFNDIYWFDQSACSSPRLIFWVGDKHSIQDASKTFYKLLQKTIEQRHYEISFGGVLLKQTYMYDQALTLPIQSIDRLSNELCILVLDKTDPRCRFHCGQGILYDVPISNLEEMISFVTPHDQTLTTYGFSSEDLQKLALHLKGRGITRIVPFGQALNFDPVWDGQDIFAELTQHIIIEGIES